MSPSRLAPALLAAALTLPAPAAGAGAQAPVPMLRLTLPLAGEADRPAWRPRPARSMSGRHILSNLDEGWLGVGILAAGAGVLIYQEVEKD